LSLPHRHLVNSVDGACWSDGRVGNDGILARGAAGGAGELELSVRQVKRLRYALKKRSGTPGLRSF
jgi:hypothetical protein